jgi:ComF family protein
MTFLPVFKAAVSPLLDYALPPRCPACGVIVETSGSICSPCWITLDFVGEPICARCGDNIPTACDDAECGACLANPPSYARARAVVSYGDVARTIAHRLKYGRRLSFARVMASHMARLLPQDSAGDLPPLLIPVPLHRWRIWTRGFNQSALIAGHLASRGETEVGLDLLRRVKATPPLHGLSRAERAKVVQRAFALAPKAQSTLHGRHVILIDDIWTTGATATACARLLSQAGAARVEVLCWARVNATDH